MAIGKQRVSRRNLDAFLTWAIRNGYTVLENPRFGAKTVNRSLHRPGSWHGDGLAADINWSPSLFERSKIKKAIPVAQSMGLATIYALLGVDQYTRTHQNHLHVDVGASSDHGKGLFLPPRGDLVVWDLQDAVGVNGKTQDNLWGKDTDRRLELVRAASVYRGRKFPAGVKNTQKVLGVHADGKWGPRSAAAHDRAVKEIQRALEVTADGVWGARTDEAFRSARSKYLVR